MYMYAHLYMQDVSSSKTSNLADVFAFAKMSKTLKTTEN